MKIFARFANEGVTPGDSGFHFRLIIRPFLPKLKPEWSCPSMSADRKRDPIRLRFAASDIDQPSLVSVP